MDFQLVWTEAAQDEFHDAVDDLLGISETAAETLRQDILDSVETLIKFPWIGPIYERGRQHVTREITARKYRIFYQVNEPNRRIEILSIWHTSRRPPHFP